MWFVRVTTRERAELASMAVLSSWDLVEVFGPINDGASI